MNRFCAERLQSLVRTLELNRLDEYSSLQKVANFATLVSTYEKGINLPTIDRSNNCVIFRLPAHSRAIRDRQCHGAKPCLPLCVRHCIRPPTIYSRTLKYHTSCMDPAIAIKPVFERFSSVVITSGTISPLDMYPKMLQFTPVVQETYAMTLTRNAFLPLVGHYSIAVSYVFNCASSGYNPRQ